MSALDKLAVMVHERWQEHGSIEPMAVDLSHVFGIPVAEAQEWLESLDCPEPTPERTAKLRDALKARARKVLDGEQEETS